MKSIIFGICSLAFINFGYTQSPFLVTDPVQVTDGFGNHHPQIEVTNDGRANISWTDMGTESAYFAKHNGVDGFMAPVQLNPDGLGVASYSWSGPDFTIEGENVYAVFRAANFQSYLVKSTDNGLTFGDTVRIASDEALFPFYPDVAVLRDTVYATFMNHLAEDGSNPNYVFSRSTDGGESFEDFVLASNLISEEVCDCCPPEILVNDHYVIIFFRNNDSNIRDIKAVVSYDRGETFSDWFSVDDHEWNIAACPSTGPDARFINDHEIASVYKTNVEGDNKIFFNRYNLQTGDTETLEVYAAESTGVLSNYPQICFNDNELAVVWEDLGSGTAGDIFFNASSSTEINFNPSNALNLTALSGPQTKPDIALYNGIYHVVYAEGMDGNLYYLQVGEPNAIYEMKNSIEFSAYPSPIKDVLMIQLTDQKTHLLKIIDLQGQEVFSGSVNGSVTLSTAGWSKGIYFLSVSYNNQTTVKKVVK